jgi:hypothetical protein
VKEGPLLAVSDLAIACLGVAYFWAFLLRSTPRLAVIGPCLFLVVYLPFVAAEYDLDRNLKMFFLRVFFAALLVLPAFIFIIANVNWAR